MVGLRKGVSVTVESILAIGGILASILFFISFYNLAIYQADNVFSASEKGFIHELGMRIDSVHLSRNDLVELPYEVPVSVYKLSVKDRKMSVKYPSREAATAIVDADISDASIENSGTICIRKANGVISISGSKCQSTCNMNDDECDEGCELFGVCDPRCDDCNG